MQKLRTTSLSILLLAVICVSVPTAAKAETGNISNASSKSLTAGSADQAAQDAATKAAQTGTDADKQAAADAAATAKQADDSANQAIQNIDTGGNGIDLFACDSTAKALFDPLSWANCAVRIGADFIFQIASFILGLTGTLFNWVITKTVFQFASLIGNSAGVLLSWRIMRDLGNMLLLFGFIFIGLATILDLQTYAAKKALPKLIIFAILMNFSLFAAEAVIDTSNAISTVFYNQTRNIQCAPIGTQSSEGDTQCNIDTGIAGAIMDVSGLGSIFHPSGGLNPTSYTAVTFIGMTIFAVIGSVVFLAASVMLIFRVVSLTFLMVLAPLGFAALAIPPLQKVGRDWWNQLLHQSFFAPILVLLLFVTLKVSEGFSKAGGDYGLAAALSQNTVSFMGVIMVFALIIGFLIASLVSAKKFGAMGADFAVNWGTRLAFGSTAGLTNLAVGGGTYGLKRFTQKRGMNDPVTSFIRNRALRPLSNANLDMRRLPGMSALLKQAGAGDGAGAGTGNSFMDLRHDFQNFRGGKRGKELAAEDKKERDMLQLIEELKTALPGTPLSPDSERTLAGLSAEQIAAEHDLQHSIDNLAGRLSADQFEGMMKSDSLDQPTKDSLSGAQFSAARTAVTGGYANRDTVRNMSNKDLELLAKYDPRTFATMLQVADPATGDGMLSQEQSDALGKTSALTPSQRSMVKANTKTGRIEDALARGSTATAVAIAQRLSSKGKAKLSAGTLTNPDIINTLTQGDLAEIQREGKLDPPQIHSIATDVKDPRHPNNATIASWLSRNPNAGAYWN